MPAGQNFAVFVEGLKDLQDIDLLKPQIEMAAIRSINRAADAGRTKAQRAIMEQVNFPSGYLNPSAKRLFVSRKAQRGKLEARITARSRPTSLARFSTGPAQRGAGVRVEVQPGRSVVLPRAVLVRLRGGSGPVEPRSNMGLAVRLKPGDSLRNKRSVVKLAKGLYLLYGPSVDQVFLSNDGTGVADDLAPEIAESMAAEFMRLLEI
jgi:hypothetical protein